MKVGAVSGDLVVKLALVAGGLALAYYLWRRASNAAGDAIAGVLEGAANVADYVIEGVNPTNPENFVNRAVSAAGAAVVPEGGAGWNADGSWNLGSALFDAFHPGWAENASGPAVFSPTSEELTTASAAAFGWFPQLGRGTSADVRTIATRGRVVGGL